MGLFDGARVATGDDDGSTADIAGRTGWPVVLVVDAGAQAASAAAVVRGFASHDTATHIAGVIFNRVGSASHAAILQDAMAQSLPEIPVLGCLPRGADLQLPSRHLGLVQALEHPDLESFLNGAAAMVADHIDTDALAALTQEGTFKESADASPPLPVLGQRIAVAQDTAFAFAYDHVLDGWRRAGAEVNFFSPLADQAPEEDADAVYLPGGYPELHAGTLAGNASFLQGLRDAASRGARVFGECGGYMVLGSVLTDADGESHAMAGLLPLATSFAERKLHLGYRRVQLVQASPLGVAGAMLRGHEFHYASIVTEKGAMPLFHAEDAAGTALGSAGLSEGTVAGSFIHLIDTE